MRFELKGEDVEKVHKSAAKRICWQLGVRPQNAMYPERSDSLLGRVTITCGYLRISTTVL